MVDRETCLEYMKDLWENHYGHMVDMCQHISVDYCSKDNSNIIEQVEMFCYYYHVSEALTNKIVDVFMYLRDNLSYTSIRDWEEILFYYCEVLYVFSNSSNQYFLPFPNEHISYDDFINIMMTVDVINTNIIYSDCNNETLKYIVGGLIGTLLGNSTDEELKELLTNKRKLITIRELFDYWSFSKYYSKLNVSEVLEEWFDTYWFYRVSREEFDKTLNLFV